MCLSIAIKRPNDVLATGEHEGFEWAVTHNGRGYRCGYVRVPKGHAWHGKHYGDIDADVHGGLTFAEADRPCGKGDDDAWWVGFDAAHSGDYPDPSLPGAGESRYGGLDLPFFGDLLDLADDVCLQPRSVGPGVRTQEYVEAECRNLCDQAKAAAVVVG